MELMTDRDYEGKPKAYFDHPRVEIESLLPQFSDSVLDIGCGSGATLNWLKSNGKCNRITGIELFEEAGNLAKQRLDKVFIGAVESQQEKLEKEKFDLILLLDVLEHLVDPWNVLKTLVSENLKPQGTVIACVPNVKYYSVVLPLLFKSDWNYEDAGVLDRTHLRFFTKKTARHLLEQSGLKVQGMRCNPLDFSQKRKVINALSLGVFKELLTQQYIFRATL